MIMNRAYPADVMSMRNGCERPFGRAFGLDYTETTKINLPERPLPLSLFSFFLSSLSFRFPFLPFPLFPPLFSSPFLLPFFPPLFDKN